MLKCLRESADLGRVQELTLNLEQFVRLCDVLGVPPSGGADKGLGISGNRGTRAGEAELRLAVRIECRTPITLALTEGKKILPTEPSMLRDVSPRGMTLSHTKAIKPETRLVVYLGASESPVRVVGQVVHCKCFADGTSLIRLSFLNFIDPASKTRKSA